MLKKRFGLENPQVEIAEVTNQMLDSRIVAEKIASELERFGANRFKGIMHKAVEEVLAAGGMGIEIRLSGKLPGARAKRWRVAGGYLRKCGDAAITFVNKTILTAQLKPGVIGIQVKIMPPGIVMPDEVKFKEAEEPKADAAVAVVEVVTAGEKSEAVPAEAESVPEAAVDKDAPKPKKKRASRAKPKKDEAAAKVAEETEVKKESEDNESSKGA